MFNFERIGTILAGFWLGQVMNSSGTAVIVLSTVQSVPSGGKLCGTTDKAVVGQYIQGLVRQGNPLVTYETLYWVGTGQA